MAASPEDVIANLRAIIISSKGGLKLPSVEVDYRETFGVDIPLKALGCHTVKELFLKNPDNFLVTGSTVQAVSKPASLHIVSLVNKQKTTKKSGRSKLSSRDDRHFRTPLVSNVQPKKFSLKTPIRPLQQSDDGKSPKDMQSFQSKKIVTNNIASSCKNIKEKSASLFANQTKNTDLKGQTSCNKEISHHLADPYVPFSNIDDFCGTLTSQLRLSKTKNAASKNLSNSMETSNNQSCDISNPTSMGSPFRRSLINNSQRQVPAAKTFAKINTPNAKLPTPLRNGPIPSDLTIEINDGVKYETLLKQFCKEKGLTMPSYSIIVRESSEGSKTYGCKVDLGSEFIVSTYPVETHSETSAKELVSKMAYQQLNNNNNLQNLCGNTEYVTRLRELCSAKYLPEPVFKSIECTPKNQPKYFICKVRIGEDILLSSYPFEAADEISAKDLAAMKAYDHLNSSSKFCSVNSTGNDTQTLSRIYDMLKTKEYGVWYNKIQHIYFETYNEEIPVNWFDLVKRSQKFEITTIEKVGFIIRTKHSENTEVETSKPSVLATLKLPESNQWEVYITNVISSAEIWCRLIGKDYSEAYDSMMTKLELHPPAVNVSSPTVGNIYLVNMEESWNRIKVLEILHENAISVFLIDIGVDEIVKKSQIYILPKPFFALAPQAILLSLNELDSLAECKELQTALFHSLLGNTFIAEIVSVLDEGGNVSSVNLWDTSTSEDVNVNLKLLDDVVKTITSPSLPMLGIVKEMFVSHVDDNGDLYFQESKQSATFLEWIISTKIKNSRSLVSINNRQVDPKKLYVTRSIKTGLFYRAKLVKVLNANTVLVKFIDYGYEQQAAIDDLLDLELTAFDLATIPCQVIRTKLNSKNLSSRSLGKIRDSILEQNVLVKVVQTSPGLPPMVDVLKRSQIDGTLSSVNKFNDDEIEQAVELPPRKKSFVVGLENTLTKNLPMPNIPPVGSYFDVFVTLAAHPGLFNVQPLATQKDLMELMIRLQEKCEKSYSKPLSPEEFKIGELYAVKYSDNTWYRAYAQAFTGSSIFIVCLCDFGDFVEASPEKLMPLPGEFKMFPYQAVRAYLAGIEPVEKDWSALDCVQFRGLVIDKQFVSQIIEINRDVKNPNYISLGLVLVDTSTSEDVYIHKMLIENKIAVLKN